MRTPALRLTGRAITLLLVGLVAVAIVLACAASQAAPPAAREPMAFVTRSGTDFVVDGEPFSFGGANMAYLRHVSRATVDQALATAAEHGFTVIRVFGFVDIGNQDGSDSVNGKKDGIYFHYWNGSEPAYNDGPDGLQHLDYVIYRAGQLGLRLIIPFTNNWYYGGGMDQYVRWRQGQFHDQFYTDPLIRQWYKRYVAHLLNRVNVYSGVAYKDDPAVFAWQLANEPQCGGNGPYPTSPDCRVATLVSWVAEMSAHVKSLDANHLVGVGDQGYYCIPGATERTEDCRRGTDAIAFAQVSTVDFMGFHLSDVMAPAPDWGVGWIQRHVADADALGKPVIMDEFGWQDASSRDAVYQAWMVALRAYGGDGSLFWQLGGPPNPDRKWSAGPYTIHCPSDFCATLATHARQMSQAGQALPPHRVFLPLPNAPSVRAVTANPLGAHP